MSRDVEKTVRVQRYLSMCGIASRRDAEELIRQRRVAVNGRAASLGQKVRVGLDEVTLDGESVHPPRRFLYLKMYKPRGYVCTEKNEGGRPRVYDLLPALTYRVFAVGRLDLNSEGLLLFMNDGAMAQRLMRPSTGIERVYHVKVQGRPSSRVLQRLRHGVRTEAGFLKASRVKHLRFTRTNQWLVLALKEGKNREIRRLFDAVGFNVLKIRRVRYGPIRLGRMQPGEVRFLTPEEIQTLKRCTESRSECSQPLP